MRKMTLFWFPEEFWKLLDMALQPSVDQVELPCRGKTKPITMRGYLYNFRARLLESDDIRAKDLVGRGVAELVFSARDDHVAIYRKSPLRQTVKWMAMATKTGSAEPDGGAQ